VGGEPFRIVLANNGHKAICVTAEGANARMEKHRSEESLSVTILERVDNGAATWRVDYE